LVPSRPRDYNRPVEISYPAWLGRKPMGRVGQETEPIPVPIPVPATPGLRPWCRKSFSLMMWRNNVLRVVPAVVAAAIGVCCGGCEPQEAPPTGPGARPNVLIVTFDTTRFDHLSCYGYDKISTPAVDALAARGIRYTRCYATAPITLPSHTSILTGLYPLHHRLHDNGTGPLDEQAVTLAEVLRDAGYTTGAVIGAQVLNSRYGLGQGFQQYDQRIDEDARSTSMHFAERPATAVTDAALSWLAGLDAAPYFLWVHYFDPHAPYHAPGGGSDTTSVTSYDAEIAYADQQLGRLLESVHRRDQTDNSDTIIIFAADHGEGFNDHGEWTHGLFVYNATIQTPLIVVLPGRTEPVTVDAPVSLVDIYPSVLKWLNLKPPYELDGVELPLAPDSPAAQSAQARPIYLETQLPFNSYGWSPLEGVVLAAKKYISAPRPELYDVVADPGETRDFYRSEPQDADRLTRALDDVKERTLAAPVLKEGEADTNAEAIRQLEALGYVGHGGGAVPDGKALADPKDLTEIHNQTMVATLYLEDKQFGLVTELLRSVLTKDPDNRWAISLLIKMLREPAAFAQAMEVAQSRMSSPLPEEFEVTLPTALGFAAARAGRGAGVVGMLQDLLKKKPDAGELRCALAAALMQTGKLEDAEAQLNAALKADPKLRMALTGLGDLAVMKRDFAAAARQFQAAVDAGEATAETYAKLGQAYQQLQRNSEAIDAYKKAIEANHDLIEARLTLADLLANLDRVPEAIEQYKAAIHKQPQRSDAHYNLGLLYARHNRMDEARRCFEKAVELKPDSGDALINLGIVLMQQRQPDQAAQVFDRAKALDSVAAEARYMLGIVAAQRGHIDETVRLYEEAIRIKPSYFGPVDELSRYYQLEGRTEDAVRVLRVGVEHQADNVTLLERLARILSTSPNDAVRNGAEALKLASRAADLAGPGRPDVLATLAAAQAETGDYAAAVATSEKALGIATGAGNQALIQQLRQQLEQYRAQKPFRSAK